MAAPDPHSMGVPRPQFPRLCPACLPRYPLQTILRQVLVSKTLAWLQSPDPSRDTDGVFGTHRSKKCRNRILFGVIYLYQTSKTSRHENIPDGPFGVANLELDTFSL